jgi:hypothetical protein
MVFLVLFVSPYMLHCSSRSGKQAGNARVCVIHTNCIPPSPASPLPAFPHSVIFRLYVYCCSAFLSLFFCTLLSTRKDYIDTHKLEVGRLCFSATIKIKLFICFTLLMKSLRGREELCMKKQCCLLYGRFMYAVNKICARTSITVSRGLYFVFGCFIKNVPNKPLILDWGCRKASLLAMYYNIFDFRQHNYHAANCV